MKNYPVLCGIKITAIAAEGKAIAKVDGKTLFVPMAVPDDVVDVQICRSRRDYMEGYIVRIVEPSPLRQEPFCRHYGVCGGCKWQILPYHAQLYWKQRQIEDQFVRIGNMVSPKVEPIIACPQTEFYRNKLEYTFSSRPWVEKNILNDGSAQHAPALGFHAAGRYDKVLNIDYCWLQGGISNALRNSLREFAIANNYTFYDQKTRHGLLRNLIIRSSGVAAGAGYEVMAAVVFSEYDRDKIDMMMDYLHGKFPQITSLLYVINGKCNDSIADCAVHCWAGNDYITEALSGMRFRFGLNSFYQTNSDGAQRLYDVVCGMVSLAASGTAYDLYCGTGTIACCISKYVRRVVGIEIIEDAVKNAWFNAKSNGIKNAEFYAGDVKNLFSAEFIAKYGSADVIIVDPPRAGLHPNVVRALLHVCAARIIYVSCNPATQARDIAMLAPAYRMDRAQPVDMFAHTHHVENVALLLRNQ